MHFCGDIHGQRGSRDDSTIETGERAHQLWIGGTDRTGTDMQGYLDDTKQSSSTKGSFSVKSHSLVFHF